MDRRVLIALGIVALCAAGYFLTKEDPTAVGLGKLPPDSAVTSENVDWSGDFEKNPITAPLFKLTEDVNVGVALDSLQALSKRDPIVAGNGHQIAHSMGRFAFRVKPDLALLSVCRPTFSAGCYHGVLEGYLQTVPSVDAKSITATCASLAQGDAVITSRECAHGLGHGLLERMEYSLDDALKACGAFGSQDLKVECYDGTFMENLVHGEGLPTTTDGHQHSMMSASKATAFKVDDLGFPCDSVAVGYQPSCWNYQPTAVARMTGDRGETTLQTCKLPATEEGRVRCYRGFGKQNTTWQMHNELRMLDACSNAPKPYNENCIAGLVEALIDQSWAPDTSLSLCSRMKLLGGDPKVCYETLGERIVLLYSNPTDAELVCAGIKETEYAEACKRGMGRK